MEGGVPLKQHIRLVLARLLRQLPLRSKRWGSPRLLAEDAEAWAKQQCANGARFHLLRDGGTTLSVPDAKSLNPDDADWYSWNKPWPQRRQFILQARTIRYESWTGAYIGDDGSLLEELAPFQSSPGWRHPLFSGLRLPPIKRLPGHSLILSARNAGKNYYHWMNNLVPRKLLLDKAGLGWDDFDYVIVNQASIPFQQAILDSWQVPRDKLFFSDDYGLIECEEATMPSLAFQSGFDDDETLRYYQELVLGKQANQATNSGRKLYLRRHAGLARAVLNEAELLAVLHRYGFEVVDCEKLSLKQQAELFSGARAVVAPHGAALTNIIFMPPGGSMLEFFPQDYHCSSFWWICGRKSIAYSYLNSQLASDGAPYPRQGINVCVNTVAQYLDTLPA